MLTHRQRNAEKINLRVIFILQFGKIERVLVISGQVVYKHTHQ